MRTRKKFGRHTKCWRPLSSSFVMCVGRRYIYVFKKKKSLKKLCVPTVAEKKGIQ